MANDRPSTADLDELMQAALNRCFAELNGNKTAIAKAMHLSLQDLEEMLNRFRIGFN